MSLSSADDTVISARKNRETKANTGLLNTGLVCGSLDNTRPNGAARGYAGMVG
jgi:hypothetical protein